MSNIIKEIKGIELTFKPMENKELWINATKLAKDAKKRLQNYWDSPETAEYCKELIEFSDNLNYLDSRELKSNSLESSEFKKILSFTKQGRGGGTYIHPELMIHFARWLSPKYAIVCDKAVKQIVEDGYFISNNLQPEQETVLVNKVLHQFNRKVIDELRVNTIGKIRRYLSEFNYTDRQVSALISTIYNHCHVATLQATATMIVCNKVKEGLKEGSLNTISTTRHIPSIYMNDYHSAINYYTDEELDRFGKYFDMVLNKAEAYIDNPNVECTPLKIRDAIDRESRNIVREFSGLDIGTKLESKNRDYLNEIVNTIYKQGFIFTEEEKEIMLDDLDSKRSRSYEVK